MRPTRSSLVQRLVASGRRGLSTTPCTCLINETSAWPLNSTDQFHSTEFRSSQTGLLVLWGFGVRFLWLEYSEVFLNENSGDCCPLSNHCILPLERWPVGPVPSLERDDLVPLWSRLMRSLENNWCDYPSENISSFPRRQPWTEEFPEHGGSISSYDSLNCIILSLDQICVAHGSLFCLSCFTEAAFLFLDTATLNGERCPRRRVWNQKGDWYFVILLRNGRSQELLLKGTDFMRRWTREFRINRGNE